MGEHLNAYFLILYLCDGLQCCERRKKSGLQPDPLGKTWIFNERCYFEEITVMTLTDI